MSSVYRFGNPLLVETDAGLAAALPLGLPSMRRGLTSEFARDRSKPQKRDQQIRVLTGSF